MKKSLRLVLFEFLIIITGVLILSRENRETSDNRFLYDEITLIFTGASNEYKIYLIDKPEK